MLEHDAWMDLMKCIYGLKKKLLLGLKKHNCYGESGTGSGVILNFPGQRIV